VILATLSRPASGKHNPHHLSTQSSVTEYAISQKYIYGIFMLVISLFLTAWLGVLQERTYRRYGPVWKEALFYTVRFSPPASLRFTDLTDAITAPPLSSNIHSSVQRCRTWISQSCIITTNFPFINPVIRSSHAVNRLTSVSICTPFLFSVRLFIVL
jgi:hypothetical protein